MIEQVRFKDLLKEPVYRRWILKDRPNHPVARRPWRVFVQVERGGKWAKKDFARYRDALKFAASWVKRDAWDLAIHHAPSELPMPVLKRAVGKRKGITVWRKTLWMELPQAMEIAATHDWCGLCRRPTVFRRYRKHHAFPRGLPANPDQLRCCVCGASKEFACPRRRA